MKKVILLLALIQFLATVVFSQNYGTGDNTTEAEFKKILRAATRSRGDNRFLPTAFSIKQFAPEPQQQGKLETCVGWSTAYAARTISYMLKKNLTHPDSIKKYAFSPGYIYFKIKDPTDKTCQKGTSIVSALETMKKTGAMLKKEGLVDCMVSIPKKTEQVKASPYKIKDFQSRNENFGLFSNNDILEIKKSITEKKPVVISMRVDDSFKKISADNFWSPSVNETSKTSGHAMCIVGYNDSIGTGGSFEVMNSWGANWGNKGFFWLGYQQLITHGKYALELMDFETPITRGVGSQNLEITGSIEFLNITGLCKDGKKTILPVTSTKTNAAGQLMLDDKNAGFKTYYLTDKTSRFQIRFSASTQSYIYIFSQDDQTIISPYFPPLDSNISAAINSPNTQYYLPDEYSCGQLDMPTRENFCILYSKSEINLKDLVKYIKEKKTTILQAVKFTLGKRLVDLSKTVFNENEIKFRTPADENSVLCFFVEMNPT